jgi:hypothetical protein
MTSDVDVIKEGIEGMIRAGYYRDREALLYEAFRTMIEVNPSLRSEVAVELYKSGKISLGRAAEIAGVSAEGFKNLLEMRGIKRVVAAPPIDQLNRGVGSIFE